MEQVKAEVLSNNELLNYKGAKYFLMELSAGQIAQQAKPGQFVMIKCGEEALLRRPISIHSILPNNTIQLLYACSSSETSADNTNLGRETEIKVTRGIGTNWLTKLQKGMELDIIGPLGNGFKIRDESKSILLIAGGIGIAPLKFLAEKALAIHKSVTILHGARYPEGIYPRNLLPESIKVINIVEDNHTSPTFLKGRVIDLIPEHISNTDEVFACGPRAMYQAMEDQISRWPVEKPVQISLEVRMGCGFGVCYGCSIKTVSGIKTVCKDGPVFNIKDIIWQEVKI